MRAGAYALPLVLAFTLTHHPTDALGQDRQRRAGQDRSEARQPPSEETRATRRAFTLDLVGRRNSRLRLAGERIRIDFTGAETSGDDYARFRALGDDDVVTFTRGAAIKLRTEIDLVFRDVRVTTDNVAPDYPGVYGVWLRKLASGWELALTDEPDVWGTQYERDAEVLVLPLTHTETSEVADAFTIELVETGDRAGEIALRWGPHRWVAGFRVEGP